MTKPREWPNKYREHRDKAAKACASAQAITAKLIRTHKDSTQADREHASA